MYIKDNDFLSSEYLCLFTFSSNQLGQAHYILRLTDPDKGFSGSSEKKKIMLAH